MRLEELEQAVDAMVWRSWTAVGVSGWSGEGTATVVDVEPLIAFTALATGGRDPRLGREVLAWVAAHVDLVSAVQARRSFARLGRRSAAGDLGSGAASLDRACVARPVVRGERGA